PTMTGAAPDLSSLVSTAKGWESPGATTNGMGAVGSSTNPGPLAAGSSRAAVPLPADSREPLFEPQRTLDHSAPFDPMATLGGGRARGGDKRTLTMVLVGGAVLAVVAVV